MVEGQEVLELGSGCGLCGILAAKLGARQVCVWAEDFSRGKGVVGVGVCQRDTWGGRAKERWKRDGEGEGAQDGGNGAKGEGKGTEREGS